MSDYIIRDASQRRLWASIVVILAFTTTILLFFLSDSLADAFLRAASVLYVGQSREVSSKAVRRNVWADLSANEVVELYKWIHENIPELNLTAAKDADPWDNFIHGTELIRPSKTEALSYIDGGSQDLPQRWARIVLHQGTSDPVTRNEYMVGPLPVSSETTLSPSVYTHSSGMSFTNNLLPDSTSFKEWPYSVAQEISDITQDLLGTSINLDGKEDPDGLEISFRDPWLENGRILRWCSFNRAGSVSEAQTLLPQGLYMKIDTTTRHPKSWRVLKWFYNNRLYNSTEEFRNAWLSHDFEKVPPNLDGNWTIIEDFEGINDREQPAPRTIQHNPRYKLDREESHVTWMGFQFYWAFAQATGTTLYDVRFRGERIFYELGLQEAMSQYAGSDPVQGAGAYLDSFFGMGKTMFELVPGYDCPAYADFLDTQIYSSEKSQVHRNAMCIFEFTADYPLQRHTASSYVTISRNTYLVLRATSVVGNYDYTIDYIFYLDGTVEVKVRASGFIQGAYYLRGHSEQYGYRLNDQFASSMHDHVINFKADMDVAGPKNTLLKVDIDPATVQYPWSEKPRKTMKLSHSTVRKETGLDWPPNSKTMYMVSNTDAFNRWGEPRSYRIIPGTGVGTPAHLTFEGSEALGKAAQWSTRDLWITKQRDTEPRSASAMNAFNTHKPIVDFGAFVNGEDIEQEDL